MVNINKVLQFRKHYNTKRIEYKMKLKEFAKNIPIEKNTFLAMLSRNSQYQYHCS